MAELKVENTSRTNLKGTQGNYETQAETGDHPNDGTTKWDFPNADQNKGYYINNHEFHTSMIAFGNWVTGRGYTSSATVKATLNNIRGYGEDNFLSIMRNYLTQKKSQGHAFCQIVRDKETKRLINLKVLYTGDITIVTTKDGMTSHFLHQVGDGKENRIELKDMLHSSNNRYGSDIRGIPITDSVKWLIDAMEEARRDYRVVLHRNVIPVRIIEIAHDNKDKRDALIAEYQDAIAMGEVLVIPKGTVEFKDNTITIVDPTNWIRYLENAFYLAVGVPKVILGGSSENTEASAKVDFLAFEEVYNKAHEELESDLWNQVGIRVKFNKPASLQEQQQESEAANTGQVGFQPNDTQVGVGRQ